MNAQARRQLEMAARVIVFSRENPDDTDPGYAAAVARLAALVERAGAMAQVQREGVLTVRTASTARRELRRTILRSHVAHLAGVAELAAREQSEVRRWFVVGSGRFTFSAFRTAVRLMLERAEGQRTLLERHGLSPKVLDDLRARLAEFDAVTEQSRAGRSAHVGASAELDAAAAEAFDVVKVLDGVNRLRFARDAERLSQWRSVSSVQAAPQHAKKDEEPAAPGEVRPAA
jgi:hypothetical protein